MIILSSILIELTLAMEALQEQPPTMAKIEAVLGFVQENPSSEDEDIAIGAYVGMSKLINITIIQHLNFFIVVFKIIIFVKLMCYIV